MVFPLHFPFHLIAGVYPLSHDQSEVEAVFRQSFGQGGDEIRFGASPFGFVRRFRLAVAEQQALPLFLRREGEADGHHALPVDARARQGRHVFPLEAWEWLLQSPSNLRLHRH